MKAYIIAIYFLLFHISAVLTSNVSTESQSRWTTIVGNDGTIEAVDPDSTPEDAKHTLEELKTNVRFYLFTAANPEKEQEIYFGDDEAIKASHFNASNPTQIVIHGWQSSVTGAMPISIRNAYLNVSDRNVIVVDWSSYASKDYIFACTHIVAVGEYVGLLIDYLGDVGVDPKDLIIVGHSLGAHVAGVAGRSSRGNVGAMFALDPAGPLFYLVNQKARINSTDASFVQVIHTSAGSLGHLWNLGDTDIWANGGASQPGCGLDLLKTCAHGRAYEYMAESIERSDRPFVARLCDNDSDYNAGKCDSNNSTHIGGINVDTESTGVYHLNTNSKPLYAIQ